MSIRAFNDFVGCTPMEKKSVTVESHKRFTAIVNRTNLTELTVLFGNDRIPVGSKVYITSDQYVAEWAKKEFTLGDTKFILVPMSMIQLVEFAVTEIPPPPPAPTRPPGAGLGR